MGHIHTSASFYYRGIPNSMHVFGAFSLANYSIVKPYALYKLNSNFYDFAFQHNNGNSNNNINQNRNINLNKK
jgi:hypothetical protein